MLVFTLGRPEQQLVSPRRSSLPPTGAHAAAARAATHRGSCCCSPCCHCTGCNGSSWSLEWRMGMCGCPPGICGHAGGPCSCRGAGPDVSVHWAPAQHVIRHAAGCCRQQHSTHCANVGACTTCNRARSRVLQAAAQHPLRKCGTYTAYDQARGRVLQAAAQHPLHKCRRLHNINPLRECGRLHNMQSGARQGVAGSSTAPAARKRGVCCCSSLLLICWHLCCVS